METLFIGKNMIFLPETESTNSYAIDLLKNVNLPEGTVIHTANQTKGKGQRGSIWNTDVASNLTASVILKPDFLSLKNRFFLYQVLALACYDTMAELLNTSQFDIKIKWPNDILINRKKIAGILIENNIVNNRFNWSVAGIGINVNQQNFDKAFNATSLKHLSGKDFIVNNVLELLCTHLEKYYLMLRSNKREAVKNSYLLHLFGLNTWMDFEKSGTVLSYFVEGISEEGLLVLQSKSGVLHEVDVKEVKWLY